MPPYNHARDKQRIGEGKEPRERTECLCIFTFLSLNETSISSRLNKKLEGMDGDGREGAKKEAKGNFRHHHAAAVPATLPLASNQPPRERRKQTGLGF